MVPDVILDCLLNRLKKTIPERPEGKLVCFNISLCMSPRSIVAETRVVNGVSIVRSQESPAIDNFCLSGFRLNKECQFFFLSK